MVTIIGWIRMEWPTNEQEPFYCLKVRTPSFNRISKQNGVNVNNCTVDHRILHFPQQLHHILNILLLMESFRLLCQKKEVR